MLNPPCRPIAWYDTVSGEVNFGAQPVRKPSTPSAEWAPLYASSEWVPGAGRLLEALALAAIPLEGMYCSGSYKLHSPECADAIKQAVLTIRSAIGSIDADCP